MKRKKQNIIMPTKIYTPVFSQSAQDDPIVTSLENSLGGTPVWTRRGAGDYICTLAGAFTLGKTHIPFGSNYNGSGLSVIQILGNNASEVAGYALLMTGINADAIYLTIVKADFTTNIDWSDIAGDSNFHLPEVKVYP
jgi:hypothetical protein